MPRRSCIAVFLSMNDILPPKKKRAKEIAFHVHEHMQISLSVLIISSIEFNQEWCATFGHVIIKQPFRFYSVSCVKRRG